MKPQEELAAVFREEALELAESVLSAAESLQTAEGWQRDELILQVFRKLHSVKGAAGMIGFRKVETLSHELEEVLAPLKVDSSMWQSKWAPGLIDAATAIYAAIENTPDDVEMEASLALIADFATQVRR